MAFAHFRHFASAAHAARVRSLLRAEGGLSRWIKGGSIMRSFVHAAVFALEISAPVLAGALMDNSVASLLGATDSGCSSSCSVGSADPDNPGNAQGGHSVNTFAPGITVSGGGGGVPGAFGPGHITVTEPFPPGTSSGNFTTVPSSKGRCTGSLSAACS